MQEIKELCDNIKDELNDAEKYAKLALLRKGTPVAETYYNLSNEEMKHMSMLHNCVVKTIDDYRKTKGEPPQAMQAVYDYLHREHIDQSKEVKLLQSMYKE